jgi:hypothetical protein
MTYDVPCHALAVDRPTTIAFHTPTLVEDGDSAYLRRCAQCKTEEPGPRPEPDTRDRSRLRTKDDTQPSPRALHHHISKVSSSDCRKACMHTCMPTCQTPPLCSLTPKVVTQHMLHSGPLRLQVVGLRTLAQTSAALACAHVTHGLGTCIRPSAGAHPCNDAPIVLRSRPRHPRAPAQHRDTPLHVSLPTRAPPPTASPPGSQTSQRHTPCTGGPYSLHG